MIRYSVVIEQPDSEPITLDQAKDHLEYQGTLKDQAINSLIPTARRICEVYTGLSLITQERSIKMDRFPCYYNPIEVPYGPVQSILTFTYTNSDGDPTILVEGTDFLADYDSRICRLYAIDSNGNKTSWPTDVKCMPNAIEVTYQAGYDDVSGELTPEQARTGIKRVIAQLFEGRGDSDNGECPDWTTKTILDTIKVSWNANYD